MAGLDFSSRGVEIDETDNQTITPNKQAGAGLDFSSLAIPEDQIDQSRSTSVASLLAESLGLDDAVVQGQQQQAQFDLTSTDVPDLSQTPTDSQVNTGTIRAGTAGEDAEFATRAVAESVGINDSGVTNFFGDIAKEVVDRPTETALSLVANLTKFGVVKKIALDIIGSTIGRQVDQEEESFAASTIISIGVSLGSATGGAVLSRTAREVAEFLPVSIGKVMGVTAQQGDAVTANLLRRRDIDPLDASFKDIVQAQKDIAGRRLLTITQETGGAAGKGKTADLAARIRIVSRVSDANSKIIKMDNTLRASMDNAMLKGVAIEEATEVVFEREVSKGLVATLIEIDADIVIKEAALVRLAPLAEMGVERMHSALVASRASFARNLPPKATEKMYGILNKHLLVKDKSGDIIPKDTIKMSELNSMLAEIEDFLPTFSTAATTQKAIAGSYARNIKSIIVAYKDRAAAEAGAGSALSKVLVLEGESAVLSASKRDIVNSKVAKSVGITDAQVGAKGKGEKAVLSDIFRTPATWEQTVNALSIGNPALIPKLVNRHRLTIMQKVKDKSSGSITFNKIDAILKDADVIEVVHGKGFLETLKDIRLITAARESSPELLASLRGSSGSPTAEQAAIAIASAAAGAPMGGIRTVFLFMSDKARRVLNMGPKTDAKLTKLLTGARGQELMDAMSNVKFVSPRAYGIYSQLVRTIGGIPLSKRDYDDAISTPVIEVLD